MKHKELLIVLCICLTWTINTLIRYHYEYGECEPEKEITSGQRI